MSIKSPADITSPTPKFIFSPTWDNYTILLSGSDFLRPLLNSTIVSVGAVCLTFIIGLPAAYALARMKFRGKEHFAFVFLSLWFAPELFIILPLFLFFKSIGLYDSHLGLIFAYQLITFPLVVWMMRSFIEDVPVEIDEAVQLDGGGWFRVFRMVGIRLVLPGLGAAAILAFIYAWNNFVFSLILSGRDTQVLTTTLLQFMSYQRVQWGPMAAGLILTILPEFVLAIFALKHMIRGLTAGAIK